MPILAADTAATSPTPPGGEITIIFLEASADGSDDMDREEDVATAVVLWNLAAAVEEEDKVVVGTIKASALVRAIAEAISAANAIGAYLEYMIDQK